MTTERVLLLLLSLLLLAGCNEHDPTDAFDETSVDILSRFNADGNAWMSLELNLPTAGTPTRATTFDDGDGNEYAVKTLKLVLFHGPSSATEDQLTVASTYDVTYSPVSDSHTQTTNHSKATIQITNANISSTDRLYMLAIANASPTIVVDATFASVKNTVLTTEANTTPMTTKIDATEYFIMSNSPLSSANNGTGTVSTLTWVNPSYLFATEAKASANPAATIFLERAAAKVTVTESVSPKTILGNTNIDFSTGDMRFALYNYNDRSYLVRHFISEWLPYNVGSNYRFTENVPLSSLQYRTYWAEDINYTGRDNIRTIQSWKAMAESYYCAENTFSVANMTDENTTSVVVRIRVNGANDFYTTSVTGSDVIYQLPANTITEDGTSASSSFSRRKSNKVTSAKTIDEYLREWLMETNKDFRDWVRVYAAGEPRHVNIAVYTGSAGMVNAQVTNVTQTAQASGSAGANAFNDLNLKAYINNNITLNYYWQGYTFYRLPIRHFNNTETPWVSPPSAISGSATDVYNASAASAVGGSGTDDTFLGRYGVVRNNWYTINVTSVTHVGYPIIPPLTNHADDSVEQLLNATLLISGWERNDKALQ